MHSSSPFKIQGIRLVGLRVVGLGVKACGWVDMLQRCWHILVCTDAALLGIAHNGPTPGLLALVLQPACSWILSWTTMGKSPLQCQSPACHTLLLCRACVPLPTPFTATPCCRPQGGRPCLRASGSSSPFRRQGSGGGKGAEHYVQGEGMQFRALTAEVGEWQGCPTAGGRGTCFTMEGHWPFAWKPRLG